MFAGFLDVIVAHVSGVTYTPNIWPTLGYRAGLFEHTGRCNIQRDEDGQPIASNATLSC